MAQNLDDSRSRKDRLGEVFGMIDCLPLWLSVWRPNCKSSMLRLLGKVLDEETGLMS